MKHLFICIASAAILYACKPRLHAEAGAKPPTQLSSDSFPAIDTALDSADFVKLYVVITDTGNHYPTLMAQMYQLAGACGLSVDTLNRFWNSKKNELVLGDTAMPKMFRGHYFPRRIAGSTLSIEYMRVYTDDTRENTLALVAGIFNSESDARATYELVKKYAAGAFIRKSLIYIGCMH